jgi:hypothetical protein
MRLILKTILFFLLLIFATGVVSADSYDLSDLECDACFQGFNEGCRTVEIDPRQKQSLWDNYLRQGLKPSKMYPTGQRPVEPKEGEEKEIEEDQRFELNTVDPESREGLALGLPRESVSPNLGNPILSRTCKGEFSFGVVLDDTFRVARCEGDVNVCAVSEGLRLRNSDGVVDTFTKSISSLVPGNDELESPFRTFKEANQETLDNVTSVDEAALDNLQVKQVERQDSTKIPNHMQTSNYSGRFESVCQGGDAPERCTIMVFSYFDKYYNSFYTGSMVSFTAGPLVYGLGKNVTARLTQFKGVPSVSLGNTKVAKALGGVRDKFRSLYVKDIDTLGSSISAKMTRVDSSGVAGLRKDLEGTMGEKDFSKALEILNKDGSKALVDAKKLSAQREGINEFVLSRRRGVENVAYSLAATTDDASKIAIMTSKGIEGSVGEKVGKKVVEKEFGRYKIMKDGRMQSVAEGWEDFARGEAKYVDNLYVINPAGQKEIGGTLSPGTTLDDSYFSSLGDDFFVSGPDGVPVGLTKDNASQITDLIKGRGEMQYFKISGETFKFQGDLVETGVSASGFSGLTPAFARANSGKHIKIPDGTMMELTEESVGGIQKAFGAAYRDPIKVYTATSTFDTAAMQEKFVEKFGKSFDNYRDNYKALQNNLELRGFFPRVRANALNQAIAYDSAKWGQVAVAGKWMAGVPIASWAYWTVKKEQGFIKGYEIQEGSFNNIGINTGQDLVYNDSFLDVFANASLNNGDFFEKAFEKLLFYFDSFREVLFDAKITHKRESVQDVILYHSSNEDCPTCNVSYSFDGSIDAIIRSRTFSNTVNYFLEKPDAKTYRGNGLTLGIYTHHSNINFEGKIMEGIEEINIQKGVTLRNTCVDRAKNVALLGLFDYFSDSPTRMGLPIGILDNTVGVAAGVFFPASIGLALATSFTFSIALNKYMDDEFDGCIDSEDGYFVQYFYKPRENKEEGLNKLTSLISGGSEQVKQQDALGADKFTEAMSDIKNSVVDTLSNNEKEFLQFKLETKGKGTAKFETPGLFLSWIAGGSYCSPTAIDRDSSTTLETANGEEVVLNKVSGQIIINDEVIIDNPDIVRTLIQNNIVGAMEMANSLTIVPANGYGDYFELKPNGDILVVDPFALECLREGLEVQTGRTLISDSLVGMLGKVIEVQTLDTSQIVPQFSHFSVLGGELERGDLQTNLLVDNNIEVVTTNLIPKHSFDQLISITLEKGTILYDSQKKEFHVWARILAEMLGKDIKALRAEQTRVKNPITDCDEYAIDLSVLPVDSDVGAKENAEGMNQALKKAGPYQYFETNTKIFMFYSKLENGVCKDFMKVTDKATGKVLTDAEISQFENTGDGFRIKTEDGKTHDLKFSSENGNPYLDYNGQKDLLLMAQGREGSFYFDPNTKTWRVANSQMLPMDDKFRTDGSLTTGNVTTPGGNPIYINTGSQGREGSFDIPLFEKSERFLFIILSALIALTILFRSKKV